MSGAPEMKIIFLHIPKAGGTTFHRILERVYRDKVFFDIRVRNHRLTVDEFTSMAQEERNKIDILKGHMPFGLHRFFQNGDVRYITFFRHPVERIVSHYRYLLRKPNHYLYKKVTDSNLSLIEYATSDLSEELDNHMCRLLIEDKDIPINGLTSEHFNAAVENLNRHFIFFGMMEEFDKSLILFKETMRLSEYPYYVKMNVRPEGQDSNIAREEYDAIAQRNSWDMKLYNQAMETFQGRLREIGDLGAQLLALQTANQAYANGIRFGQQQVKAPEALLKRIMRKLFKPSVKPRSASV